MPTTASASCVLFLRKGKTKVEPPTSSSIHLLHREGIDMQQKCRRNRGVQASAREVRVSISERASVPRSCNACSTLVQRVFHARATRVPRPCNACSTLVQRAFPARATLALSEIEMGKHEGRTLIADYRANHHRTIAMRTYSLRTPRKEQCRYCSRMQTPEVFN